MESNKESFQPVCALCSQNYQAWARTCKSENRLKEVNRAIEAREAGRIQKLHAVPLSEYIALTRPTASVASDNNNTTSTFTSIPPGIQPRTPSRPYSVSAKLGQKRGRRDVSGLTTEKDQRVLNEPIDRATQEQQTSEEPIIRSTQWTPKSAYKTLTAFVRTAAGGTTTNP